MCELLPLPFLTFPGGTLLDPSNPAIDALLDAILDGFEDDVAADIARGRPVSRGRPGESSTVDKPKDEVEKDKTGELENNGDTEKPGEPVETTKVMETVETVEAGEATETGGAAAAAVQTVQTVEVVQTVQTVQTGKDVARDVSFSSMLCGVEYTTPAKA